MLFPGSSLPFPLRTFLQLCFERRGELPGEAVALSDPGCWVDPSLAGQAEGPAPALCVLGRGGGAEHRR